MGKNGRHPGYNAAGQSPSLTTTARDIATGDSNIGAAIQCLQQAGNNLRWMLQVGINDYYQFAANMRQSVDDGCRQPPLVAEVSLRRIA